MNPFVSVIIPNYNHTAFLDERIQSVLNQTYLNFEVIILDDASTDNSVEVIEKYKSNAHVSQIVVNEKNSGSPFIQWNKGMELAKGDLIWIAESDDSCELNILERLVNCFERDDKLSYAFTRSTYMDAEGHYGHICQNMFPTGIHLNGRAFNHKYMIWGNKIFNASSVVFRKSFAIDVDKAYMNYKGAGDWLFWIEMAEKGNVAVVSEPLNHYRMYDSNTTSVVRLNGTEDVEDRKIYEYFKQKGYLSLINDIRIQKKYICSIKYSNEYINENVKCKSVGLWNPNVFISVLTWISKVCHNLFVL